MSRLLYKGKELTSGGGTADQVIYNHEVSGLLSDNVQDAIDELKSSVNCLNYGNDDSYVTLSLKEALDSIITNSFLPH